MQGNNTEGAPFEKAAIDALGVPNNNDAGQRYQANQPGGPGTPKVKGQDPGRPDTITPTHWVDAKSNSTGGPKKEAWDSGLAAQKVGANNAAHAANGGTPKEVAVVLTGPDHTTYTPNKTMVQEADLIFHRNSDTGRLHQWDESSGGWVPTTKDEVRSALGL